MILYNGCMCIAGASFVQWNRLNGSVIGSAHDSDIRIWDMKVIEWRERERERNISIVAV